MINKFRLLGVQASRALACFYFFCFCFFVENKAGIKISVGGDLSRTTNAHSRSPTNMLHSIEWYLMQKDKLGSSERIG